VDFRGSGGTSDHWADTQRCMTCRFRVNVGEATAKQPNGIVPPRWEGLLSPIWGLSAMGWWIDTDPFRMLGDIMSVKNYEP
jgi:hypothetical protein